MQLRPGAVPTWMAQAGCEIATPGRSFVYLGVSTSSPINEENIAAEIVQKLMKKLKHWSNRFLSWPAKTLLLKHVLAATPLYQLLSVGLCKDGLDDLERLCRNFLWGWTEEGNPKHALVAWERIVQSKEGGGLGWTRFRDMSDAVNTRLVCRLLEGGDAEWLHDAVENAEKLAQDSDEAQLADGKRRTGRENVNAAGEGDLPDFRRSKLK
ncbi:hypothetical protein R1sor_014235 [Riccia sorocarpa]|uniref:Reverse transcriptase n=1 Tax=Riccia sorocarpa TaxID=122646 RepID=A0ABD3HCZ8_9MARC